MRFKAISAALLTAGLTTPAAADVTDPAPTDLRISWKDTSFQFVHVSWAEDGARPNTVFVRTIGQTARAVITEVPADAANAVDLPKAKLALLKGPLEIGVVVGTAAADTSLVTVSQRFDNNGRRPPTVNLVAPTGASTLTINWWGDSTYDATPGDPLDRDVAETFQPQYSVAGGPQIPIGRPITAVPGTWPTVTFTGPATGYSLSVATANEWGAAAMQAITTRPTRLTATIPTSSAFGRYREVRGTFDGPAICSVVLQARNSTSSPWYRVDANDFENGKYWLMALSQGTRQYRMVMPNQVRGNTVYFGTATAPVTMTTYQVVRSARFLTTTLKYGAEARAELLTTPAITGKVSLQRWNGKTWTGVKDVAITKGRAVGTFQARQPGRVAYRYYVPARTWNGLYIAAVYSPNFVLTTVR